MDNTYIHARAVEFVFSLPKYSGVNVHARESFLSRRRDARSLVTQLEAVMVEVIENEVSNLTTADAVEFIKQNDPFGYLSGIL